MASKLIYLLVVLCAFQCAQCAGPQKRGLIDILKSGVDELKQLVETTESKILGAINNFKQLTSQISNSITQSIQQAVQNAEDKINSAVKEAVQAGKNVTGCVAGQLETLRKIGAQVGPDFQNCTQPQLAKLQYILKDAFNLKELMLKFVAGIPSGLSSCSINLVCVANYVESTLAKFTLMTSSVNSDLLKLEEYKLAFATVAAQCGKDALTKTTSQIWDTTSTTISCIQNGPGSS